MKRLSISKAWEEATAFLAREMRLIVPVALATYVAAPTVANWMEPRGLMAPSASPGRAMVMLLLILLLAFVGQMTIASLAIGQSGSVGETMGRAFRGVWRVLLALFLVMFPMTVVAVIAAGSALAGAGLADPASITPEALAEVPGIAPIVLILLILLLSIWARLLPISAVAMKEGGGPLTILSRSWALTKGNFWRLLATVLLILIVETILTQAFTYVGGSIFALAFGRPDPFSATALLTALLVSLAGAAVSVIAAALVGRIYAQASSGQVTVPEVSRED